MNTALGGEGLGADMNLVQIVSGLTVGIPTLLLARKYWRVWNASPGSDESRWVSFGVGLFLMEFIVMHSGAFMIHAFSDLSDAAHLGESLVIMGLYGVMAAGIAYGFRSKQLFFYFGSVCLGRAVSFVLSMNYYPLWNLAHLGMALALYVFCVTLSIFPLPRKGIQGRLKNNLGTGHWVDKPHCAIGAGFIYYLLLGLLEIFLLTWIDIEQWG